jgi:hypothetical protein
MIIFFLNGPTFIHGSGRQRTIIRAMKTKCHYHIRVTIIKLLLLTKKHGTFFMVNRR